MGEKIVGGKDNQMVPCDGGGTQCGDNETCGWRTRPLSNNVSKAFEQQCI